MELHTNSFLQGGKYKIEKVLGQGGFGITYLGIQMALNRKVAIKEFFMKEYCERNSNTSHVSLGTSGSREIVERFRTKFIKEAQTIAEMDNNHIIRIYDVFEENGTAYYVMEYLPRGDLSKRIPNNGLPETEALGYIRQIGDALTYIHSKNILHLDIKPTNILFRRDGEAVLIDFGVSKHYDDTSGSQTSNTPVGISEGYAPTEQYDREAIASFAPSTDVYSLGATLYCLLCGTRPPKASVVLNEGLPALPPKVSASTRKAVEKAMAPRRKDRPQSVTEFINLLHETVSYDTEDESTHLSEESKKDIKSPVIKHTTKKNWVSYLLYSILSLLCLVGVICWVNRDRTDDNEIPLTENASNINPEVDTISTATISESQTVQTEENVKPTSTPTNTVSTPTKSNTKKEEPIKKETTNTGKEMMAKAWKAYNEKNYAEAVTLYKKLAEEEYAGAQYCLGICYHNGEGVTKNPTEAVKWVTKAAENGYTEAQKHLPIIQYTLGWCYHYGERGVTKNIEEAIKWYSKAAQQGNNDAQKELNIIKEEKKQNSVKKEKVSLQDIEDDDSIPVRKETVHRVEGSSLKKYAVVANTYGILANAQKLMIDLQFEGYAAVIVFNSNTNIYRVLIESYSTKKEAVRTLEYFKKKYSNDKRFIQIKPWLLQTN